MKTTTTQKADNTKLAEMKAVLSGNGDFLRPLVQTVLEELMEGEMEELLGARKGERTAGRLGHRSGYYTRKLITRVGTLELRVPQDRAGRFSTEVFKRYQRSEKALVSALVEMYVQGARRGKSKRSARNSAGTSSARAR